MKSGFSCPEGFEYYEDKFSNRITLRHEDLNRFDHSCHLPTLLPANNHIHCCCRERPGHGESRDGNLMSSNTSNEESVQVDQGLFMLNHSERLDGLNRVNCLRSDRLSHRNSRDLSNQEGYQFVCSCRMHWYGSSLTSGSTFTCINFERLEDHYSHGICLCMENTFSHEHGQFMNGSAMLLHKLASLFNNSMLSDVELKVENKVYQAHKLILTCSSDVFQIMLTNAQWGDSKRDCVVLHEEPVCIPVFESFLRYLYTGLIQVNHYNVLPILLLADKYNVCSLRKLVIHYMIHHLVSTVEHNHAVSWFSYSKHANHQNFVKLCRQFICSNFYKVMSTDDFLNMEPEELVEFLRDSDLVIPDELSLFNGVVRWLQHQAGKMYAQSLMFSQLSLSIFTHLRFNNLTVEQLNIVECHQLVTLFPQFFHEKLNTARDFHNFHPKSCDYTGVYYRLRNYTRDTWATTFCIDNFQTLERYQSCSLCFSSPVSNSEFVQDVTHDWSLELFPKGVQYHRCILIGLWNNKEISGQVEENVRLSLKSENSSMCTVEIAVLIIGIQDGVEYVKEIACKRHSFAPESLVCNFDQLVPYNELNRENSVYLSGPSCNSFKIIVIIKPVL